MWSFISVLQVMIIGSLNFLLDSFALSSVWLLVLWFPIFPNTLHLIYLWPAPDSTANMIYILASVVAEGLLLVQYEFHLWGHFRIFRRDISTATHPTLHRLLLVNKEQSWPTLIRMIAPWIIVRVSYCIVWHISSNKLPLFMKTLAE